MTLVIKSEYLLVYYIYRSQYPNELGMYLLLSLSPSSVTIRFLIVVIWSLFFFIHWENPYIISKFIYLQWNGSYTYGIIKNWVFSVLSLNKHITITYPHHCQPLNFQSLRFFFHHHHHLRFFSGGVLMSHFAYISNRLTCDLPIIHTFHKGTTTHNIHSNYCGFLINYSNKNTHISITVIAHLSQSICAFRAISMPHINTIKKNINCSDV